MKHRGRGTVLHSVLSGSSLSLIVRMIYTCPNSVGRPVSRAAIRFDTSVDIIVSSCPCLHIRGQTRDTSERFRRCLNDESNITEGCEATGEAKYTPGTETVSLKQANEPSLSNVDTSGTFGCHVCACTWGRVRCAGCGVSMHAHVLVSRSTGDASYVTDWFLGKRTVL